MVHRQHLLSGLALLVVCLIAFVCTKSYNESVSLTQDESSHSECMSSVEKIMKALDFSSLRDYEDHVLSTGKALPCGLRSHSTVENVTHSGVLSHRHKQTLWSMIFGNFFEDDSDRDHQKTSDRSHKHHQTVSKVLASAEQRNDHHIIAAARTNWSELQQHSSHPAPPHPESSKKNSIHNTNKIGVNANFHKAPLVKHAAAISNRPDISHNRFRVEAPTSVPTSIANSAAIPNHELGLPLKVPHAHLERIVNVSASPTTSGMDGKPNSGSTKRTNSEGRTKSEDWLMKLKREAYHLGYALVPQHRDTNVRSADLMPPELSIVDSNQQHDFVSRDIPAVQNTKSETLIETEPETSFKTGFVVSSEAKSKYASQGFNARKEQTERPAIVSPLKTHRSFFVQGPARPKASDNENAFEVKDQQRLESEARIEAAMHAQLQAESRRAREKLNREGATKAVQAQSAAMDAIQRYANVISFQDSDSDKAKFQKLSLDDRSSSLTKKDDNTIRNKILLSQELRNEAGKAADKQLESYGFLQFSDDGIHEVPKRTADARGGDSRASGTASAANRKAPMQWNGRGIPRFDKP